ncbi:TPA: hypothetical protein RQ522_001475 [Klebsiella pneumoniae]|nr:hypothetical protein [Klebsiella pneumoniae]HDY9342466.1 hypothetical protein [Klebsiella pneumoniae]
MSDDKESKNQENQSARPNSLRRLKVIGGSDFDAEFDNSSVKVQDHFITSHTSEREVDRISREELEARLSANKAEMESIASSIRVDMALARENTNVQFANLSSAINSISSKIDGKMDSVDGEMKAITGKFDGIQGQITGLNTAISGIQSGISTRLAIFSVIIAVIVALPGIISSFKDSPAKSDDNPSPLIIQMPAQQQNQQPAPQNQQKASPNQHK